MYKIYAQAFFIVIILLVIFIFFDPEKSVPFLSKTNMEVYLFLVAILLFASFPIALIIDFFLKSKKIIFKITNKKIKKIASIFKSKLLLFLGNTFGFLLVLLVCAVFLKFSVYLFVKTVSKPIIDPLISLLDQNKFQINQFQINQTRNRNLEVSIKSIKSYLKDKEFRGFLEKGAKRDFSHFYGKDSEDNKFSLKFNLWRSTLKNINEFSYSVYQREEGFSSGHAFGYYVGDFEISSTDNPKLNFKTFKIPNATGLNVLVVWWKSMGLKKYVIFGPSGEKYGQEGFWAIKCLLGCQKIVTGSDEPSLLVDKNKETGKKKYLIKVGERLDSALKGYIDIGYELKVNQRGGLNIQKIED